MSFTKKWMSYARVLAQLYKRYPSVSIMLTVLTFMLGIGIADEIYRILYARNESNVMGIPRSILLPFLAVVAAGTVLVATIARKR